MRYFKSKMSILRREYKHKDRAEIIAAAGGECPICHREEGDIFVFGPTNYLKQQIKFRVRLDIHVIGGSTVGITPVVMCDGCHISYHLFNRLGEDAFMGNKKLSDTLYKRCPKCKELNCTCCKKCGRMKKWCKCRKPGRPKKKRLGRPRKNPLPVKKLRLRAKKR